MSAIHGVTLHVAPLSMRKYRVMPTANSRQNIVISLDIILGRLRIHICRQQTVVSGWGVYRLGGRDAKMLSWLWVSWKDKGKWP